MSQFLQMASKNTECRKVAGEAARYVIVGGGTYVVDLAAFLLVIGLAPTLYLYGNVIGRIAGAAIGFLLHKYWTFGGEQMRSGQVQALSYVVLLSFNILLSSLLLFGFTLIFEQFSPVVYRVMTDVIVITFTFFCSKIIFR